MTALLLIAQVHTAPFLQPLQLQASPCMPCCASALVPGTEVPSKTALVMEPPAAGAGSVQCCVAVGMGL